MRHADSFIYVIEYVPEPPPIFAFLQKHGQLDDYTAYAEYNMGAGFALMLPEEDVSAVRAIARKHNIMAWHAGYVSRQGTEKKLCILPKKLEYLGDSLGVR